MTFDNDGNFTISEGDALYVAIWDDGKRPRWKRFLCWISRGRWHSPFIAFVDLRRKP